MYLKHCVSPLLLKDTVQNEEPSVHGFGWKIKKATDGN